MRTTYSTSYVEVAGTRTRARLIPSPAATMGDGNRNLPGWVARVERETQAPGESEA